MRLKWEANQLDPKDWDVRDWWQIGVEQHGALNTIVGLDALPSNKGLTCDLGGNEEKRSLMAHL